MNDRTDRLDKTQVGELLRTLEDRGNNILDGVNAQTSTALAVATAADIFRALAAEVFTLREELAELQTAGAPANPHELMEV